MSLGLALYIWRVCAEPGESGGGCALYHCGDPEAAVPLCACQAQGDISETDTFAVELGQCCFDRCCYILLPAHDYICSALNTLLHLQMVT